MPDALRKVNRHQVLPVVLGVLLALCVGTLLFLPEIRLSGSAATRRASPPDSQVQRPAELSPDSHQDPLARVAVPAPEVQGGAPADAAPSRKILGRVVFPDCDRPPEGWASVRVLTDVKVEARDSEVLVWESAVEDPLFSVPVNDAGVFEFQLEPTRTSALVAAVGVACVSEADVEAVPGRVTVLRMTYVHGLALRLLDSETMAPPAVSPGVAMLGAGRHSTMRILGRAGEIRSHIALKYLRRHVIGARPAHTYFRLATTDTRSSPAPRLKVHLGRPGYRPWDGNLPMPLLAGEMPSKTIELEPMVPCEQRSSIRLTIERSGDWRRLRGYPQECRARLLVREAGTQDFTVAISLASLLPGTQTFEGVPIASPEAFLDTAYRLFLYEPPDALQKIDLLATGERPHEYEGVVDCTGMGALLVPPLEDATSEFAWIALKSPRMRALVGTRYRASTGLVVDGLPPDRYAVYWDRDRMSYLASTNNNTPLLHLDLLAGVNTLTLP